MNTQTALNIDADPVKTMALAICEIEEGMKKIVNAGLNRRTLVVLLQDRTGLTQKDLNSVLDALGTMKRDWLA